MAYRQASISEEEVYSDEYDTYLEATQAECLTCSHVTESFGTSERSVRRCLVLLREECPLGESNYYGTE